jgi:beta-glucosidase
MEGDRPARYLCYMADLTTEPRWARAHETFTEDADLMTDITSELLRGLQGPVQRDGHSLSPSSAVALTLKHFPGGGPQEMGWDPHYTFGKNQIYTDKTGKYGFGYHLKPFKVAINGGVSSIMPYYGVPIGVTYEGVKYDEFGMAFSKQIVTDLLRKKLGFKGYVNSDSGVIETRGWGLESYRTNPATGKPYTAADRTAIAIKSDSDSDSDVLSEFSINKTITDLVAGGLLSERQHIDPALTRLLTEQFQLGLFENPYVDAEGAAAKIGKPENRALGLEMQRQSVVLLQNRGGLLPLKPGAKVYTLGFRAADTEAQGFSVTDGNAKERPTVPAGTDALLIKVMVNNAGTRTYKSNDPATGGKAVTSEFPLTDPRTGKRQTTWGAQDPCVYEPDALKMAESPDGCLDSNLIFGGPFPWESNMLALSDIAKAQSWTMTPSLADIQAAMREIGDLGKVVISIYFRNPYVLDDASGVKSAGALLATFGVSDAAQLDIISGRAKPKDRLPFALPRTTRSVLEQHPDAPGYAETQDGALFPYGFGLGY